MIPKIPNPQPNTNTVTASIIQQGYAKEAANKLAIAFDWAGTVEGYSFWHGVHNRLKQIADNGILKE